MPGQLLFILVFNIANCCAIFLPVCNFDDRETALKQIIPESYRNLSNHKKAPNSGNVTVYTRVLFVSFFDVQEQQSTIKANLYFTRAYLEPRLNLKCAHPSLVLYKEEQSMVWEPPVGLLSMLDAVTTETPHTDDVVIVESTGVVTRIKHLIVRTTCNMNFQNFPFDWMTCEFPVVVSQFFLRASTKDYVLIKVEFGNPGAEVNDEYNVMTSHEVSKVEWNEVTIDAFGPVAIPMITVTFKRFFTHYILLAYIPNTITVWVAYLSFFVDPSAVPGRVTLGISSLIAMVLQYGNIVSSMPRVGYVKSIDLWMEGCIFFIFSTLVEFAVICFLIRNDKKRGNKRGDKIDRFARIFYPVGMVICLIVYFAVYAAG